MHIKKSAKALGLANDKAVFSTKNNGDGLLYFVNKKKLDRQ
jgi:hypothetical protein